MGKEEFDNFLQAMSSINESIRKLTEITNPIIQMVNDLPKIDLPIFTFPQIEFPKIILPEIDYDRLKKITNHNSTYGWAITGTMELRDYFDDDLLEMKNEDLDKYFYKYYSSNKWEIFNRLKKDILETIEPSRKVLTNQCLLEFKAGRHKIIIPTLLTIIEGEVVEILETNAFGGDLYRLLNNNAENDDDTFRQIATYGTYRYLTRQLYRRHSFTIKRRENLNRHWVLHGRDDPTKWTKFDSLRLINVIGSLQFIKEYRKI